MKLNIAILGTRGIPNHYGGFEQITSYIARGIVRNGHTVTVYNSHKHPYQLNYWHGVRIVHCFDPEYLLGTAGQFLYDLNCIVHARKEAYDAIVFMGYTSSSVWSHLFPPDAVIISNMDGMEWKRTKYSSLVQKFLKWAERQAVLHSDFHIADSLVIQEYLASQYKIDAGYIPYGASLTRTLSSRLLRDFEIKPHKYFMLMSRMEPENNVDMILDGFNASSSDHSFLVIGNMKNGYGKKIKNKYKNDPRIRFAGTVFDQKVVHTLRKKALVYFHGHSVGGTNPSLLEAMGSGSLIAAHDNPFNRAILQQDAIFFNDPSDIQEIVESGYKQPSAQMIANNCKKIISQYNWPSVISQYEQFITLCYKAKREGKTVTYMQLACS